MLLEKRNFKCTVGFVIAAVTLVNVASQNTCLIKGPALGVCVPPKQCPVKEDTQIQRYVPPSDTQLIPGSSCGTFNDVKYLCCVQIGSIGASATKPLIRAGNSETEVETGTSILKGRSCGLINSNSLDSKTHAKLSEYPWLVLLVYANGLHNSLGCGGSLISDQYVLTAAHCIVVSDKQLIRVRLGEHDLDKETDCERSGKLINCNPGVQEIDVEEALYHKNYNPISFLDDIGMIRLARKADLRKNVQPICLPFTPESQLTELHHGTVAGWGHTETDLTTNVLHKTLVQVKPNNSCEGIHNLTEISEKLLCAEVTNEDGIVRGDSGSPLFIVSPYDGKERIVQYGVTTGFVSNGRNFTGIYMNVTSYLPWITSNIR